MPVRPGFQDSWGEIELQWRILNPQDTPIVTEGGVSPQLIYRSEILNLSTTDILGQRILCGGGCRVPGRLFSSILGLYPQDASSLSLPLV